MSINSTMAAEVYTASKTHTRILTLPETLGQAETNQTCNYIMFACPRYAVDTSFVPTPSKKTR